MEMIVSTLTKDNKNTWLWLCQGILVVFRRSQTIVFLEERSDDDVVINERSADEKNEPERLEKEGLVGESLPRDGERDDPDDDGTAAVQDHPRRSVHLLHDADPGEVEESDARDITCRQKKLILPVVKCSIINTTCQCTIKRHQILDDIVMSSTWGLLESLIL